MEPLDASDGAAAGPAGGGGGGGGRYEVWNFRIVATAFLWHQAHPPPPLPYEPDADLSSTSYEPDADLSPCPHAPLRRGHAASLRALEQRWGERWEGPGRCGEEGLQESS